MDKWQRVLMRRVVEGGWISNWDEKCLCCACIMITEENPAVSLENFHCAVLEKHNAIWTTGNPQLRGNIFANFACHAVQRESWAGTFTLSHHCRNEEGRMCQGQKDVLDCVFCREMLILLPRNGCIIMQCGKCAREREWMNCFDLLMICFRKGK